MFSGMRSEAIPTKFDNLSFLVVIMIKNKNKIEFINRINEIFLYFWQDKTEKQISSANLNL